jgi:TP901 family phage tail tape measure protein
VVAGIAGSTKAFMDFEDAMANVRKTTGFTKEQIAVLGQSINDLALRIPVAQTELANIAAVAGQLGITGQKNILDFTETAAKMSTAFDMSAESVAIAAAKLANIYDIPISQVSNLGSAINVLGNTTAASESQIMAFSMALGPAGQQLGFAATEVISLGASMISMGMDASNAGTRLNRAFTMIGQNLDELSSFMGVTTEEFTESFESMPMETFLDVIDKLSEVEGNLKANTIAADLFGEIGAKGIKSIAGNVDGLRTNLINTEREFIENTSLTEEFAAKTDTLKARFQLLKNSITSLLIDIGGELAPTLNQVIEGVKNIIPPLKDLIFEIGNGFGEMFESITRQAGSALDPLIAKVEEAGKKMSKGLNFKTLLDDIGVFIGAALNPLIRGFTWLIDKLGPLWELIGKGAGMFHDLANALKTEEGRLDDILDATQEVTKAKQDLFDINEKLLKNTGTLATALEKAGGWTAALSDLESNAKTETDALAVARKKASEAIAEHGAESEIAKIAIENVKIAEENAKIATSEFNTALTTASGAIIDSGVATEGLQKAQLDFIVSTDEATTKQGDLKTSIEDLEKELEEAKAAPFNLGEAFTNFGKRVAAIFLELPLRVAESVLKIEEAIADGLAKIGLGGFSDKLNASMEIIKGKIAAMREVIEVNIEDPLLKDVPKAAEATEKAVTDAVHAITDAAERTSEEIEDVEKGLEDVEDAAEDAGDAGEKAFEDIEKQADETSKTVTGLTDNLGDTTRAVEENESAAKALLDLDWEIFSELKAQLPAINAGIGNMEAAFSGLEIVLEQNITKLERVKKSVESISELSIPFLDKGFLDGIKVIGLFANALKDASSAINAFSDIQDVSIAGCISFSLRVNDMVSALRILEAQMEDLVPAFGNMDSLVTDIADAFLYSGDKAAGFIDSFDSAITGSKNILNSGAKNFNEFEEIVEKALDAGELTYLADTYITESDSFQKKWKTITIENAKDVERAMHGWLGGFTSEFETTVGTITSGTEEISDTYRNATMHLHNWVLETYGVRISQEKLYEVMQSPPEEQKKWLDDIMHSEKALTFQMNKQTNALKSQNEQLGKITKALAPYIDFMRTLNALAALSTLSTEELNNGLGAINYTLFNLGSTLSYFDLIPVM